MDSITIEVAGLRLSLCFDGKVPLLSDTFNHFLCNEDSAKEKARIKLLYSATLPNIEEIGLIKDSKSVTNVLPVSGGFLFSRREGQLLAAQGFSYCHAWKIHGNLYPFPEPFEGSPWVLFVLWGWLSLNGGALLHGSLSFIDGHTVLFLGNSGTGKTTLSRIVAESGFSCLTEENPFVKIHESTPWAYATPWPGAFGRKAPLSGPIKAIFFLRHSSKNELQKCTPQGAAARLLKNVRFFNWLPITIPPAIDLINEIIRIVPIYDFGFVPEKSAINTIRGVL
ncbi:hypothetical protein [Desulfopila inferna]|uniref:hypothetical protein n=1 Tax=Desulfopila inferna TaxID=468528 RepID=UPI001965C427|nr:hypothetical protein [Desulfopila inferna]MBM9605783.1 hypothetical protein [Desulfopila inferna]